MSLLWSMEQDFKRSISLLTLKLDDLQRRIKRIEEDKKEFYDYIYSLEKRISKKDKNNLPGINKKSKKKLNK